MGEGQVRGGKSSRGGQRGAEPGGLGLQEYPVVTLFLKTSKTNNILDCALLWGIL